MGGRSTSPRSFPPNGWSRRQLDRRSSASTVSTADERAELTERALVEKVLEASAVLAAEHTTRIELGTSIAVAFARNPMTVANVGWDLQAYSDGRFILGLGSQVQAHIEKRFSMPWSQPVRRMREFVLALHEIWSCWRDGSKLASRAISTPTRS